MEIAIFIIELKIRTVSKLDILDAVVAEHSLDGVVGNRALENHAWIIQGLDFNIRKIDCRRIWIRIIIITIITIIITPPGRKRMRVSFGSHISKIKFSVIF